MAINQTYAIKAPVGAAPKAVNNRADVEIIQRLLNQHASRYGYATVPVNGVASLQVIQAIRTFQQKAVGMNVPDGRVDPNGVTLRKLNEPVQFVMPNVPARFPGVFSHPDADKMQLTYGIQGDGKQVVQLNAKAEYLLKSILASAGMTGATLTSTLRTYHDQARITLTQTITSANGEQKVKDWYGQTVLDACKTYTGDIPGLAKWWEEHDKKRGRVSSLHLTNRAMDVVPVGDRTKFAAKVQELVPIANTGVRRIIPKGVMNEPVDHVEFTFDVTG